MADSNKASKRFPTTCWALLETIRSADSPEREAALSTLLERYMHPLRACVQAYWRVSDEDADDLVQGFIQEKILEKDLIGKADPERGRFRYFLLKSLKNYIISVYRSRAGSPEAPLPECEPPHQGQSPDVAFETAWARQVIRLAVARMQCDCAAIGRSTLWEIFRDRVVEPLLEGTDPVSYQVLVSRYELSSPTQASNLLVTAKRMYIRCLRTVVSEYIDDPTQVDAEIDDLREILARCRA